MQMFKIWNVVSGLGSLVIEFEGEKMSRKGKSTRKLKNASV